jgi:hypothetical protein
VCFGLRRYQSPLIRASLHEAGIHSCIPQKFNRKAKIRSNRRMYRECNRIERTVPSSTRFILPLSADAYAMQLCKQGLSNVPEVAETEVTGVIRSPR